MSPATENPKDIAGTIHFTAEKTGKEAVFPLHPIAVKHLERIQWPKRARVFSGMQGCGSRFHKYLRRLLGAAKLDQFGLHDLRRTGATEVERVRSGMGKRFLQHAPEDVSDMFYLNLNEELAEAVRAMRYPEAFEDLSDPDAGALQKSLALKKSPIGQAVEKLVRSNIDPHDWRFEPGRFCYRGRWYCLTGQRNRLLAALVTAEGEPLETARLVRLVYPFNRPLKRKQVKDAQRTISARIANLRNFLKQTLELPPGFDPLPCVDRTVGAYVLYLPAAETIGGAA